MFDTLTSTRTALESAAREFEPRTLTGEHAIRVVTELGVIRRLVDGMLGKAAQRVEETSAHKHNGGSDRDAAQLIGRAVGADASEARRAISTAKKLEQLPETDAAVRAGRLSARQAELVADAATANPRAERELLAAAREGMVPLKEACVIARAHAEAATARAARQHAAGRLRIWTAADGMVEGHFRLAPEVGGRFKARSMPEPSASSALAAQQARTSRTTRTRRMCSPVSYLPTHALVRSRAHGPRPRRSSTW